MGREAGECGRAGRRVGGHGGTPLRGRAAVCPRAPPPPIDPINAWHARVPPLNNASPGPPLACCRRAPWYSRAHLHHRLEVAVGYEAGDLNYSVLLNIQAWG
jgi:hypothetical protein